jgi:hypothetical protein
MNNLNYYNPINSKITINKKVNKIKQFRWFLHENIHKILWKIFGLKYGKIINLFFDLLDNEIKNIKFYLDCYREGININFGGGTETTSHTYYYYSIKLPHNSIDSSKTIILYDAYGNLVYTIPANCEYVNYGTGVINVPGNEKRTDVEGVATATYYVQYSTGNVVIDYNKTEFKISKSLIKYPLSTTVRATFEYLAVVTAFSDVASVIDGKYDTQAQTYFYGEVPAGYNYAIIDLGEVKPIQAIDILAGFFKPDSTRKYDVTFTFSLQYSLDGVDYYSISDECSNIQLTGGSSKSLEEDELGIGFKARYLKMVLDNVGKINYSSITVTVSNENRQTLIDYGTITSSTENGTIVTLREGIYAVAITEVSAYSDIVLTANSYLIPTTQLSSSLAELESGSSTTTIHVDSTEGFDTTGTAYILNSDGTYDTFTYTGITSTTFTGAGGYSTSHNINSYVVNEIAGDLSVYDYNKLLPKLGERTYKKDLVNDNLLFTESQLNTISRYYLREFQKNHSKIEEQVLCAPYIKVGDTVEVIDTYNNIDSNYFVESISIDNINYYTLVLARYAED